MDKFIYPPGQRSLIDHTILTFSKSKEILLAANKHSFCQVIEVGRVQENSAEFIVIEVDVERGQFTANPIDFKERLLIEIINDYSLPYVYALRTDFPALPHQNLMEFDFPKCLCLYEEPWEEIAIHWTGFSFLERIRHWLCLSAKGELHQEDQALEPFLLNSLGSIILPDNINNGTALDICLVGQNDFQLNFVVANDGDNQNKKIEYYALFFESEPRVHGIVNKHPKSLLGIEELFRRCGLDIIGKLKELAFNQNLYNRHLIIVLSIPTKRYEEGEIEKTETYTFICFKTIEEISLELNTIGKHNGTISPLIMPEVKIENLKNFEVGILKTYFKFDKKAASKLSEVTNEYLITQIGVGAIGSGVFNTLSRSGFGKSWTLIDDDVLLPHNLYRHSLLNLQVGQFKADAVSFIANHNLGDFNFSRGYTERFGKFLTPDLQTKVKDSDLILDTSASLAVSRTLSDMTDVMGRRVSIFLNPKGDTLVVLAEDKQRKTNLSELEMLYYKAIKDETGLNNHFKNSGNRVRYGNSCRDISNLIPNEYFGVFSSIASNIVKNIDTEDHAFIKLWSLSRDMSIDYYNIPTNTFDRIVSNEWNVIISTSLMNIISEERRNALPNETGGILLGSFDMNLKRIYVVDSIFSPKDSKQYPNAYYRGIEGVSEKLSKIEELTNGFLTYIGEWHSHPNKCSVQQSADDIKLFAWINQFMDSRGLPGMMIISGEKGLGIYIK